jgi:hypothetical protein
MKAFFAILPALLASLLVACVHPAAGPEEEHHEYDTVLLLYMAANNNLDAAAVLDMQEIKEGLQNIPEDTTVLLLLGRRVAGIHGYDSWDDTRLYRLDGGLSSREWTELDCPELGLTTQYIDEYLDLGSPSTLNGFIRWVENRYSANTWFLSFWNHGTGWRSSAPVERAVCTDDSSGNALGLMDIRRALIKENQTPYLHFNAVFMDACSMANIESASSFIGLADWYIASQDEIPERGWDYNTVLPILLHDSTSIEERLVSVAHTLAEDWDEDGAGVSLCKVDEDDEMEGFLDFLAASDTVSLNNSGVRAVRALCEEFAESSVDIGILSSQYPGLSEQLSSLVLYTSNSKRYGLSLYFPQYPLYDELWNLYTPHTVFMLNQFDFATVLEGYSHSGNEYLDTNEPNNSRDAAIAVSAESISSYLWCPDDVDWYRIDLQEAIAIHLTSPQYLDYDLVVELYPMDGDTLVLSSVNNAGQLDEILLDTDIIAQYQYALVKVFGTAYSFSQTESYVLEIK